MYSFKIFTTRTNTDNPFFPFSSAGQVYEEIMEISKSTWITEGSLRLVSTTKTESADGLSLTTEYIFESPEGKSALLDNFAVRVLMQNLPPVYEARDAYNATVGHTATVTFEQLDLPS